MDFKEWKTVRLEDLCSLIADCPHSTPKWTDKGVFVIRSWNVRKGNLNFDKISYTDEQTYQERIRRAKPSANDIVITREAPMGEVCIIPKDLKCCLGQRLVLLRPNSKIVNNWFLLFSLQSSFVNNQIMESEGTGSTVSNLRIPDLKNLKIPLPSLIVQEKIAAILTSIDDKIELNRQTNATLEALAQTLFKEMCLPKNGEDTEGWREVSFEDVTEADRGLSYKGQGLTTVEFGKPMHNLNSVYEGSGYKNEGIKYYNGDFKEKHKIQSGELIITNTEQGHKYMLIGYPAIIPSFWEEGIFSHHIYRLRPLSESYVTVDFLFHLLLQPKIREQVIGFANGTTVNMLKIEGLKKPIFVLPPKEIVEQFSMIAQSFRALKDKNSQEIQTLTTLRDSLLPKLMKGEIAVKMR